MGGRRLVVVGLADRLRRARSRGGPDLTHTKLLRRLQGAINHLGSLYSGEMSERLDRILQLRNELEDDYAEILRGEVLSVDATRDRLDRLAVELRSLQSPAAFLEQRLKTGLELSLGRVAEAAPSASPLHPANLGRLAQVDQALVRRAAERAPEELRRALEATTESGLRRRLAELRRRLRADAAAGMSKADLARLRAAVQELNPHRRRAKADYPGSTAEEVDRRRFRAAVTAEAIPDADLRRAIGNDAWLQRIAYESPRWLAELWDGFRAKPRPYDFRTWVFFQRRLVRGLHGEFQAAFNLGEDFILLKAPDKKVTKRGTDLVVLHKPTGRILLLDNKAYGFTEVVDDVSALIRNLRTNLADDIRDFQATFAGRHDISGKDLDAIHKAVARLEEAEQALDERLASLGPSPAQQKVLAVTREVLAGKDIERVVTVEGGRATRLSKALQALGLDLREVTSRRGGEP